jgi:DNA-binding NtrC family response regulator
LDEPLEDIPKGNASSTQPGSILTLQAVIEETERSHIRRALIQCESSVGKTAELLGISRKTLWEKMKRFGLSA